MSIFQVLKRKPAARDLVCLYAVFLVNQLAEAILGIIGLNAIATTIVCDVQPAPGVFTGSRHCGDREVVMRESWHFLFGFMFYHQILASLWVFVDIVLIESINRKTLLVAMLLNDFVVQGIGCIFYGGAHAKQWGRVLWYVGAVIHALTPTQIVMDTLFLDLCQGDLELTEVAVTSRQVLGTLTNIAGPVIGTLILRAELLDYSGIFLLLTLSQLAGCMAISHVDSTKLLAKKPLVAREIGSRISGAFTLLRRSELLWMVVYMSVCVTPIQVGIQTLCYSFSIAFLGWSQDTFFRIGCILQLISIPLAICTWWLGAKLGFTLYYKCFRLLDFVVETIGWLFIPLGSGFFFTRIVLKTAWRLLIFPISETIWTQLPHSAEDVRGECAVLFRFFGGLAAAGASKWFQHEFDAGATSYLGVLRPFLAVIVLKVLEELMHWAKVWQLVKPILQKFDSHKNVAESKKDE